ncbi:ABC transporter permease [Ostreibacterium oceani]|uniref:ABC transporter permease subunit n=1 Tax=Ostreibacterium oceani TaxID=2654998 RepID=A0A6N7EUR1_9GAMM|nr:iron ABC transporter permease [Ostreibacterium oceani]MPV86192.1 ABC transporter permease subunit [Ostreibacterium oceani]
MTIEIYHPSSRPAKRFAIGHLSYRWPWYVISLLVALMVIIPLMTIFGKAFATPDNIWLHLWQHNLGHYSKTSLQLMSGVALLSLVIGITTAYAVAKYDFIGRRWLEWMLVLPLAVPTYLLAFVYTDLLEYAGPVQKWIRQTFDFQSAQDYPFFEVRSMGSAIVTFSFVLYPYIYLLARTAFLEQSSHFNDSARVLGRSKWAIFFHVNLPLARPAIIVGLMLILMEVLNDYGAVHHFALQTFSQGIYDYWLGRDNIEAASQIALVMLSFIVFLVIAEQGSRSKQALFQKHHNHTQKRKTCHKTLSAALFMLCLIPVTIGFLIPTSRLVFFVVRYFEQLTHNNLWLPAWHSVSLSLTAAAVVTFIALLINYSRRLVGTPFIKICSLIANLGYAMPGAVLALGIMVPFAAIDKLINQATRTLFDQSVGLVLSGSVIILVAAYSIRFMAIAQGTLHSSLEKVTRNMDYSAKTLGSSNSELIRTIHLPLINKGILTAMLIVFVDCMKELPATLILRPFNYETLATQVFQYASDGLLAETAPAALLIVIAGLIPIMLLNRQIMGR